MCVRVRLCVRVYVFKHLPRNHMLLVFTSDVRFRAQSMHTQISFSAQTTHAHVQWQLSIVQYRAQKLKQRSKQVLASLFRGMVRTYLLMPRQPVPLRHLRVSGHDLLRR